MKKFIIYISITAMLIVVASVGAWQIVTDTNWALPDSVDISLATSGGNPILTVASGNTFTFATPVDFSGRITASQATSTDVTAIASYVSQTLSGSHGTTAPSYGLASYSKVLGANYGGTDVYMAGVVGLYGVTGTNASVYPVAGVIGWIADTTITADGAFVALLDGDTGVTRAGAAYTVRSLNSTAGSYFDYGLDLYSGTIGAYDAVTYNTADIRGGNGETIDNITDGTWSFSESITVADSVNMEKYVWMEDFDDEIAAVQWESGLNADFWVTAGTNYSAGNATYTAGPGGTVEFKNAAADNDSVTVLGSPIFREALNPICEARVAIDNIVTVHWAIGLAEGAYNSNAAYDDDVVLIGQDTDVAASNVYLITNDTNAGVEHADTGIDAVNGTYLKVKFDATDLEDVRVWINDVEIDISTANIQAGTTLMPYIMVQNLAAGSIQRTLTVDYFKCWQDRG